MTVPLHAAGAGGETTPEGHRLTVVSYVVNLGYVVWFWVMFAAGYWVYSWFGLDPSSSALSDAGAGGWLAALGYGLVVGLPSWIGAWVAQRAYRVGGGLAAMVALVVNLVIAVAWLTAVLLGM